MAKITKTKKSDPTRGTKKAAKSAPAQASKPAAKKKAASSKSTPKANDKKSVKKAAPKKVSASKATKAAPKKVAGKAAAPKKATASTARVATSKNGTKKPAGKGSAPAKNTTAKAKAPANGKAVKKTSMNGRSINGKDAPGGDKPGKKTMPSKAKAAPQAAVATKATAAVKAGAEKELKMKATAQTQPTEAPVEQAVARQELEVPHQSVKEKVQIEFMVRSAPTVLYELLSTPSGFSEWYCDDVDVRGDQYTFKWQGEEEPTTMIGRKLGEVIRFHRNNDEDEHSYFEFRVRIDAMTNEVALIVTDHAWPHEVDETRNLWNSQIANLLRVLGA